VSKVNSPAGPVTEISNIQGPSASPYPEGFANHAIEYFHLSCSVSGAKKEAFAVCDGN
jgi:hypothetical protein